MILEDTPVSDRVIMNKVLYKDKVYYHVQCPLSVQKQYAEFASAVGDEAYIIDNELYIDEGAFFNISMMDAESTFIIQ